MPYVFILNSLSWKWSSEIIIFSMTVKHISVKFVTLYVKNLKMWSLLNSCFNVCFYFMHGSCLSLYQSVRCFGSTSTSIQLIKSDQAFVRYMFFLNLVERRAIVVYVVVVVVVVVLCLCHHWRSCFVAHQSLDSFWVKVSVARLFHLLLLQTHGHLILSSSFVSKFQKQKKVCPEIT